MQRVWQRLLEWLSYGSVELNADVVRNWDKRQWQEAIDLGLLREIELAESVICHECGEAHWADVNWWEPGVRPCHGCPIGGIVDIEIDRLRQWRIDMNRVAQLASGSFGLSSPVEMLRPDRLWKLGRRRLGGRYREIFFGIGAGIAVSELSAAIQSSIGTGSALLLGVGCDGKPDGLPANHHLIDFASVSRVEAGRVVSDLEYVEERLAASEPAAKKSVQSIPAPPGANWRDVSITVFDEMLQVVIGGKARDIDFAELGLDPQSQSIQLLKLFAAARGTLDAEKIGDLGSGESAAKTRVWRLRQFLQQFIEVDGAPIENHRRTKTYSCLFEIRLADDDGFRAPAGVTWLDLAFHERADGRLVVVVPETRQFRAHGAQDDRGQSVGEAAEKRGTVTRTYSLEQLDLRTEVGKLTSEGSAFIQLLRAGALQRRGDDVVVLKLAAKLRAWTGLDAEPLRFVDAAGFWVGFFGCSSDVKLSDGVKQ